MRRGMEENGGMCGGGGGRERRRDKGRDMDERENIDGSGRIWRKNMEEEG